MSAHADPVVAPRHIARRCVFYFSGFDPRGGRHYHELYKTEALKHPDEKVSGLTVGPRRKDSDGDTGWTVQSKSDHHATLTEFKFMAWDDIVRQNWPKSRLSHWARYLRITPYLFRYGFPKKSWALSTQFSGVIFFPVLLIIGTCVAIALALSIMLWLASILGWPLWTGALASLLVALALWEAAHRFEARRSLGWIMRSTAFTAHQSTGNTPALDARLDEFAHKLIVRARLRLDDEILIVGHSSGAIMACAALGRALKLAPDIAAGPVTIGLVTLGQCIPSLGLLRGATQFRDELAEIGRTPELTWVDFSAVTDRCCYPMIDPIRGSEVTFTDKPQVLEVRCVNPQFHVQLGASQYEALKKNPFHLHFQYLCAPLYRGAYDYFSVSSGAMSLGDRYPRKVVIPLPADFDRETYLRLNPDIAQAGLDAEWHYLSHGHAEGRPYKVDIPEDFDSATYLRLHPDVAQAGMDASAHYALHGRREGRPYRDS